MAARSRSPARPASPSPVGRACLGGLRSLLRLLRQRPSAPEPAPRALRRRASLLYAVRRRLGSGAFGEVSLAASRQGSGDCVLKVVEREAVPDVDFLRREIFLHAEMDHPHVVRLYEGFLSQQRATISMEWCQGGDLVHALEERGRFDEREAQHVFSHILRAVRYMHGKSLAHRDLKLENFLLQHQGVPLQCNVVKVIDFGFAANFKPGLKTMKTICGTPGFTAPEVWAGEPYDEACDIFSCGVVLFCMLGGRCPFEGSTTSMVIRRTVHQPVEVTGPDFDTVSREARRLVCRMCHRSPERRPSAETVLASAFVQESDGVGVDMPELPPEAMIRNMASYCEVDFLTRAARYRVACYFDDASLPSIRRAFSRVDADGDGQISMEELRRVCGPHGRGGGLEMLFRGIDLHMSGAIAYTEFFAAMLGRQRLPESACRAAFQGLDVDVKGRVEARDIVEAVGSEGGDCQEALGRVGRAGQGGSKGDCSGMDFQEFMALVSGWSPANALGMCVYGGA